jgi:hypothetical protein
MASTDNGIVPCLGPSSPFVMGAAWLLRLCDDGVDPFAGLCRIGLRIERELGKLI